MKTKQRSPTRPRDEIGFIAESLSAPITNVYNVGGLELVFVFVGTLTMMVGSFLGGNHSTIIVSVGAVLILLCFALFGYRQLSSRQTREVQAITAVRAFCKRIEGEWWEKVKREDEGAISFFRIEADPLFNSVRLAGDAYDVNGVPVARWNSIMARTIPEEKRVIYLWEGWLKDPKVAHVRFHGFGDTVFDGSLESPAPFSHGGGKFWNVNENNQETILKPFEVRRADRAEIDSMNSHGVDNDRKRSIVNSIYRNW